MAKFSTCSLADAAAADGYAAHGEASGVVWSKRLSDDDYSLFLAVSQLADGATLRFGADHGDDALVVLEGELAVDGRVCPSGGAIIVESGVPIEVRAIGTTTIAHYGPNEATPPSDGMYGPPAAEGHHIHVVGDKGWFYATDDENYRSVWWADSRCPTCRISVFQVDHLTTGRREIAHHHTQDEIIYVYKGELRMGARVYPAGTAISIPANMRYALSGGDDVYSFLNYRRDASTIHFADGRDPIVESGVVFGAEVGDLR